MYSPDPVGEVEGPAWGALSLREGCNESEGAAVLLDCPGLRDLHERRRGMLMEDEGYVIPANEESRLVMVPLEPRAKEFNR